MKKFPARAALFICAAFSAAFLQAEGANGFRIKDRMVELGLNANVGLANDQLIGSDIFQETLVLNLDNLRDGLRMNLGAKVSPLFFNFNWKDRWGLGIFINAEALGSAAFSGNMLTLRTAQNDRFDGGGAVFAEAGLQSFFHIKKFRIKIRPSGFYPLFYAQPDMSYSFKNGDVLDADIQYNMTVYSAFSLKTFSQLSAQPGFDIGAGVEYPLLPFLDLGLDLIHIPLVPAVLKDYMRAKGSVGIETDNFFGADMGELFSNDMDITYGVGEKSVFRPFKTLLRADYRPFNTRLFSVIPSAGFSYNPLYIQPFSPEGGVHFRLDLSNLFITTLGVQYEDRLWKNSIDLTFNFRFVELGIGIGMQSQDFLKSWQMSGLSASLGLKLGW